ncbi:MAG: hypothetical protein KF855_03280 [Acidobacteria bacterium]|nr:hypothetical protein [Acidobacteriota bacterium]
MSNENRREMPELEKDLTTLRTKFYTAEEIDIWEDGYRRGREQNLFRRIGYERYEYLRTLTPRQFAELCERNIKGEGTFDDLVDEGRGKSCRK